ncbi:MAG: hypothetical protein A2751_03060 [Candidatus Doudnabacteria bacterium RIFCSPHIGHO2_01_FULL_46_14]|uniref:Haloacid dehalogenase n=1 Tax=Candidatus Doudnabacteria bacterium RIFCSPHIGHO2_01_FULL_46_14 TaxID=1817824 RepID=A0A1F5NK83_9BACT|nr:MAG: hypothetical protein A2751_03060 [Candidatus Doudnabacteria bacterium RIFCSPHIGHO2_01_FULL_46_14]
MTKYKGIIFDFNGVLLWDIPLHEKGWDRFARRHRGAGLSEHDWDHLNAKSTWDTIEYLLGKKLTREELDHYEAEKELGYQEELGADPVLSAGAVSLLDNLKSRNIPMAVATSSSKINIDFFLRTFGLEKWFPLDRIVYFDGTFPAKPHPEMYLRAAKTIGLNAGDCVVVEDAIQGIISAKAAGAGMIIGLESTKDSKALLAAGADQSIKTLEEIKPEELFV